MLHRLSAYSFGELMEQVVVDTDGRRAVALLPADWAQGRSAFGGLLAAVALRAMRSTVPADRRPRSLQISFVGPVAPGSVEIELTALRHGGSVSHVEARLVQGGEARCVVLCALGADRRSEVAVNGPSRPPAPAPDALQELPYLPGVVPVFTQHLAFRWAAGGVPFSGADEASFGGWCRLRAPAAGFPDEQVLALVDAWPAPVLPLLTGAAPASSLTWAVELLETVDGEEPEDGWWYFSAETDRASAGYAHTRAALWSPSGVQVALSRQVVVVYSERG
jgi:acyl-CoA thioesterase